jgi:hypothetical protein
MKRRVLRFPFTPREDRQRPALRVVRENDTTVVLPFPAWAAMNWRNGRKDETHVQH